MGGIDIEEVAETHPSASDAGLLERPAAQPVRRPSGRRADGRDRRAPEQARPILTRLAMLFVDNDMNSRDNRRRVADGR
jgi:succinyl-CoA synthetase beta subunit